MSLYDRVFLEGADEDRRRAARRLTREPNDVRARSARDQAQTRTDPNITIKQHIDDYNSAGGRVRDADRAFRDAHNSPTSDPHAFRRLASAQADHDAAAAAFRSTAKQVGRRPGDLYPQGNLTREGHVRALSHINDGRARHRNDGITFSFPTAADRDSFHKSVGSHHKAIKAKPLHKPGSDRAHQLHISYMDLDDD